MKTFFIVDAVNYLFRAYYALAPMTNAQGESTHALFGFIRSMYKLIEEFKPGHFIAVFDGPGNKQSRTAIYSEYKSHRKEMPKDLVSQLDLAHKFCTLAGIPYLSIPGVEADDTIGSIAKWVEAEGNKAVICSGDKDLCQLVSDHVTIINPQKNNMCVDAKRVEELFGVPPEHIVDYLALCGDASDNIPGLEGFGPKAASTLLARYGSLENILNASSEFTGKRREIVENGREIAQISKQLATIQTDVPFPKEEQFFHLRAPELPKIKTFYQEMQFLSFLKEMGEEAPPGNYHLVETEEELKSLVKRLEKEPLLCVDTETTSVHPLRAELVGVGIGIHPHEAWYIPLNGSFKAKPALKALLENPSIHWMGHNIKYDLQVLLVAGIQLGTIAFDTLLASYLIAPHQQRHNLDELTLEKFGVVKIPISDLIGKGKEEKTMLDVPLPQISAYCCEDVDYTLRLQELFAGELKALDVMRVFTEIELPLIPVLARMERAGIFCNIEKLKILSTELSSKIHHLEQQIYDLAGETFNLNSPKQLSAILFDKMGLTPPKKTLTGFSTASEVLETLKSESPIVQEVISYRALEKLRSTYVDALPDAINQETGRIHCTFNQSVAATGRLSCQSPNLQNIPVRSEEGRKIRAAFEPKESGYSFLSADYSQIELRLLAHLSEDPTLTKAFCNDEDIHTYTASLVFDTPLGDVTSEMRHRAKAVNFGILYGQQAFGLSKQLGISYAEAETFIKTYFTRYPRVQEFLHFCKESAAKTGRSVTLTGRQRPIPEIHSKNPSLKAAAERLAVNTPLQGTAADLIKIAMIQIDAHLLQHPTLGVMILQIHDELLFEATDSKLHTLSSVAKRIMEGVFQLTVPLVVDISIGKNWGAC